MILQVYEFRVLDAIAAGVKTGLSVWHKIWLFIDWYAQFI
jgi:hypothetical protein